MKRLFVFFVFTVLGLSVLAQSTDTDTFQLAVQGGSEGRILQFKPGKRLKLTTKDGEIVYTRQYSIYENHILTENNNLVLFEDLTRIKGRILKDSGRVAAGVLLLGAGVILMGATIPIASLVLTPNQFLLIAAAESGMIVGGVRIMGHRTFKLDNGWEIQSFLPRE